MIVNELKSVDGRIKFSKDDTIEKISNLDVLSKLRIPQSIWVPLAESEITDLDDVSTVLSEIDWKCVPPLNSHGPRVFVSRGSVVDSDKSSIESLVLSCIPKHLHPTELSLRIDSLNKLSIQMNAIPPRAWIKTPAEICAEEFDHEPTWSTRQHLVTPSRPTEDFIRRFRNESSLACLCASLVRLSSFPTLLDDTPEILVWDPFVGNGAVLMEILQYVADKESRLEGEKLVTIVGNVGSQKTLEKLKMKISTFVKRSGSLVVGDKVENEHQISASGGRRTRKSNRPLVSDDQVAEDARIHSLSLSLGRVRVNIQLLAYPFEQVVPHISGACIVSHIPKTYNETLGIDKRELSEWAAFGNWMKGNERNCSMHVLSETDGFMKYSKLKFSKLVHLKSPNGNSVGSIAQWLGI